MFSMSTGISIWGVAFVSSGVEIHSLKTEQMGMDTSLQVLLAMTSLSKHDMIGSGLFGHMKGSRQ